MAMSKNDGGSAFPFQASSAEGMNSPDYGMTMRDWFAGTILAGMIANPEIGGSAEELAHYAYKQADAMIAERDR